MCVCVCVCVCVHSILITGSDGSAVWTELVLSFECLIF